MGKHESIDVATAPPAPIAKSVLAHRKKLEAERDALNVGAPELALASAKGDPEAKAALAAIPGKRAALQFEIDWNHAAHGLAMQQDHAAEVAWRTSIQSMGLDEIIQGISGDGCCTRCQPGVNGGCVITAGCSQAGSTCGHPIREKHSVFGRNATGQRQFLYHRNPQAAKVFAAACKKLNVNISG